MCSVSGLWGFVHELDRLKNYQWTTALAEYTLYAAIKVLNKFTTV